MLGGGRVPHAANGARSAALSALLWIIVPATVAFPANAAAQDAKTVVESALRALGAANMTSIVYSGEGAYGNFGQSRTISFGLASTAIRNYRRAIDFTKPALRETGTAVPVAGPRTPPPTGPAAPPRPFELIAPLGEGWPAQMEIWVTPWGFLKGAARQQRHGALAEDRGCRVSGRDVESSAKAPSGQPYRVIGYINPQQIVERVERGSSIRCSATCMSKRSSVTITARSTVKRSMSCSEP